MEKLNDTLLYTLDKCFRTYHQYAQKNVKMAGYDITIDQWLILKNISENPDITQNDIGKIVFKDNASVTRIIQLLVKSGHMTRRVYPTDRRRAILKLTEKGQKITCEVNEIALKNRENAMKGLESESIRQMKEMLQQIIYNCGGQP